MKYILEFDADDPQQLANAQLAMNAANVNSELIKLDEELRAYLKHGSPPIRHMDTTLLSEYVRKWIGPLIKQ